MNSSEERYSVPEGRALVPAFYPEEMAGSANETGGLLDMWQSLRGRRGTVILFGFLGAVLGLFSVFPQTPVYQASAAIEIQPINQDFLQLRNVNPTNESGTDFYPDYEIQTQVQIIESRTLSNRVVSRLRREHHYQVGYQSRIAQWRAALGWTDGLSPEDEALAFASSHVRVRARPNTRLLQITCDSTIPQLAADFVNTLTAEYVDQSLAARWQTTQHTGEWLTRQMEDVRLKLEQSEDQLQKYARESGLMFTAEKDNVAEQKLRQLQEELSRATADRIARQSKYELATKTAPDTIADVLDDPVLREYQSKLTDLRRQLADLGYSFTDDYPKVKKLQAQVAAVDAAFQKTRADIIRRINNDYQVSEQRENLLAASYGTQAKLMSDQADKVAHYNILKHEVDTGRQVYDNLLQRVKEAGVASALRASNVRVVDSASAPETPYRPRAELNTALGSLAGLCFGLWLALLRSRADRTLRDPAEAHANLGVPLLGLIPSAGVDAGGWRYGRRGRGLATESEPVQQIELASWRNHASLVAEAFRSASTSLLFSRHDSPQVVVVTSAQPREGKTTTACNLGISLALSNHRVLLVDGDLRRPSLSRVFGVPDQLGLGTLLLDHGDVSAVDSVIRETEVPGLSILPSGPARQVSTPLLYSPKLKALLERLRSRFDMIVIDTPPMLQIPDARIFGKLADGMILVVRAARTTRETAQAALQRIAEDRTPTAGAVLNDWNPKTSSRYSVYRDYHNYYSQYYAKASDD